jgi:hypothetical protein
MNAAKEPSHDEASEPTGSPEQSTGGGGSTGCQTCDLAEIEHMSCTAKKFARQAEVMTEAGPDLETFRTQYDEARGKYADARTAALADLVEIRTVLDELAEQLRCRLKDGQVDCLEEARDKVFHEIDECSGPTGCQSPCDDSDSGGLETSDDIEALAAEIERRRRNLTESAAYFTQLVAEPDDIATRAAELKADAVQLAADVAAGGDAEKAVRWYARWLILDHEAKWERLGRGFASVSAYVDCLCVTLRCVVSGWNVLAILEGRMAELVCYAAAHQIVCDKLKADVLQAVLDAYEECCEDNPPAPCGEEEQTPEKPEEPAAS